MTSKQLQRLGAIGWWLAVTESVIALSLVFNHYSPLEATRQSNIMFAGREYVELQHPNFVTHALLSAAHFLPGVAFAIIAPLQFHPRIRARFPRFHRWCGRVFALAGLLLGGTAMAFAVKIPYGGFSELPPQIFYGSILSFSILRGLYLIRKKDIARHREWMLRAAAVGLGIALNRVFYVAFLFGTSATSREFFPTILWIGSGLNLLIGEIWINVSRPLGVGAAVSARTAVEPKRERRAASVAAE